MSFSLADAGYLARAGGGKSWSSLSKHDKKRGLGKRMFWNVLEEDRPKADRVWEDCVARQQMYYCKHIDLCDADSTCIHVCSRFPCRLQARCSSACRTLAILSRPCIPLPFKRTLTLESPTSIGKSCPLHREPKHAIVMLRHEETPQGLQNGM